MHIDEESRKEHTRRSEKEAEVKRERDNVQDGSREGIFATDAPNRATGQAHQTPTQRQSPTGEGKTWRAYWDAQQQPWRTEPEIELARQEQLSRCLATTPDITRGIYPFKGMKLSRADVEWLLAAHENGRGPIARSDEQQNRQGWTCGVRICVM